MREKIAYTIFNRGARRFGLFFLLLLGASSLPAFSQIAGVVLDDATGKPLERALVSIVKDGKTMAYVSTKADGSFVIEKVVEEPYTISIRRLSYTTITISSDAYKSTAKQPFRLKEKGLDIKPVIVKAPHVRQRGDTTSYTLSSFTSKSDVSLEDAIKKLPGVTVSASGSISYMGRSISKLTIEGEDLLGKQYTNATRNLSKKMVKSVQILENQQEIKQLQGIVGDDKIIMNLILNESAKNRINGRLDLSAGAEPDKLLYYGNATGMSFGKQRQFIGSLSFNEGIKERGVFHSDLSTISPLQSKFSASASTHRAGISEKFYIDRRDLLLNFNLVEKLKNGARFRVIADYQELKEKHDVASRQKFFSLGGDADEVEISEESGLQSRERIPELKARYYKNDNEIYLNNSLTFAGNSLDKQVSTTRSGIEPFDEQYKQERFSIGNEIRIAKSFSGNFLSFSAKLQADRYPLWQLLSKDLIQNLVGQSYLASSQLSFSKPLSKGWRLKLPARVEWKHNELHPDVNWKGDTHTYDIADDVFALSLSPEISKFRQGYYDFSLSIPFTLTSMALKGNASLPKGVSRLVKHISPSVSLNYTISNSLTARANAYLNHNLGGVETLYPGLYFRNYRTAERMSGVLSESQNMGVSGRLVLKRGLQELFASLLVSCSRGEANTLSSDNPTPHINMLENILGKSLWNSYGVSGDISKYFRSIHTKVSLSADYSESGNRMIRRGIEHHYVYNTLRGTFSLASNPLSWLEVKYAVSPNRNRLQLQGGKTSALVGFNLDVDLTLHPMNGLEVSAKGEHLYRELTADHSASAFLLGGIARYKYDKYILSFVVENLLNKSVFAYTVHDALQSHSASYPLRGRSVRLDFSYYF